MMKMKIVILSFILSAYSLLLASCSYIRTTEIIVTNESSYDLNIELELMAKFKCDCMGGGWVKNFNLKTYETFAFTLGSGPHCEAREPHEELKNILFTDLNTSDIIKKLNVNNSTFKLTYSSGSSRDGIMEVVYLLKITDDLLDEE